MLSNVPNRRELLAGGLASLSASMIPVKASRAAPHDATGYLRTNWSQDPFAFGSYSYVAKGAAKRHYRHLAEPIEDRIFFAGEATHREYNSTVHSAYETGLIAAEKVEASGARNIGIIGAGISGIAAAHALAATGLNVSVFEARDRIGGRIWTDTSLGAPLDLGASWIHGIDENPINALAEDLSIQRVPTDDSYIIRGRDGKEIADEDSPDWLEEVLSIQHSAGTELDQINQFAYWLDNDYDGVDVKFPKGYGQIFAGLEGDYDLSLNSVVSSIKLDGSTVEITFNDNRNATFDAVIVTLPLGVLKQSRVSFSPPLSARKQKAIDRLGMGVLDKFYLRFDDVFWDEDITWIATPENGLPRGEFNQWLNLYKYFREPIILAFNGGKAAKALAQESDDQLLSNALQTLQTAYPV